ncbi:MAG: C40 family peptidase, partial [Muribaculaceae bacterium]|nr:C40 family peptidase [Muribaculaceae bacterium]
VQSPEGYTGWIIDNSLQKISESEFSRWKKAERLVMTAPYQIRLYTDSLTDCLRNTVTDLVNGCIVEGEAIPAGNRVKVSLPDGRCGWGDATSFTPIVEWADQEFDAEKILTLAYSMEGQPYLWGGTSTKSLDCSGLSKVCYLSNGIILLRDASQQARTGTRIEASDWRKCKSGDLLFFGNPATGKVTHVAIYDQDGNYVHSSGRVKRNSIDPASPAYLSTPFLHAVRIHGNEGTPGITRVIDHPWYF